MREKYRDELLRLPGVDTNRDYDLVFRDDLTPIQLRLHRIKRAQTLALYGVSSRMCCKAPRRQIRRRCRLFR